MVYLILKTEALTLTGTDNVQDFMAVQHTRPQILAEAQLLEESLHSLGDSADSDTLLVSVAAAGVAGGGGMVPPVVFKRVDITPFIIAVDYKPHKVRTSDFVELEILVRSPQNHVF